MKKSVLTTASKRSLTWTTCKRVGRGSMDRFWILSLTHHLKHRHRNQPEEDKWKRSFKVLAFSNDAFGGVVEFMHQARTVTAAFSELYADYEGKKADGKLPVVEVKGSPKKVGDYYAPDWAVAKMADRPDAFNGGASAPAAEPTPADAEF